MNKVLLRFTILSLLLFLSASLLMAQERQVSPISVYKSIDSDDPLRYFHPADVGIPAGDINGDGKQEFINHTGFSPDLSTPELGDFTDKSLVCNYSDEGVRETCSVYNGGFLYPAGDLNNDGRDDLVLFKDDMLEVYTFDEGPLDVSDILSPGTYFVAVDAFFDQAVPGYDLDIDGVEDLVIASNDFTNGGTLCTIYGAENPENFELDCSSDEGDTDWYSFSVGNDDVKINVGDVIGDSKNEIVVLHTSPFPYQLSTSVFSVSDQRVINHESTTGLGSASTSARSHRFFVANADGQNKDDLIFSEDRYNQGNGFTQVFFNEPNAFIVQSIPGEIPFTQPRVLLPDNTVNQVSRSKGGDVGIGFTSADKTNLTVCLGTDIIDPAMEPVGNACTNPQQITDAFGPGDQVFDNLFSPIPFTGINGPPDSDPVDVINFFLGHLGRDAFTGGTRTIAASESFITTVVNAIILTNIFSDIFRAVAVNPSPPEIPLGILSFAEFMPRGFFTIHTQVGIALSIIPSEETVNVTGSEPNVLFGTGEGGGVHVNIFGAADLLGAAGFTFYFKNIVAEGDTIVGEQIINLHDFQQFDDTLVFPRANNIGDINDDGFDDMLFSSGNSRLDNNLINKVWIFYGGEPISSTPDVTWDFNQDSTIEAFDFPNLGSAIEPLGDVNGDGVDDFALGLSGHMGTGAVYVYFGEDNVEKSNSSMVFEYPDVILSPRILDGQTVGSFGSQISAGDFDGDGANDIAVTADGSFGSPKAPTIQIFKGGANIDGEADVFLSATRSSLGGEGDDIVSGTFGSVIQFLPKEEGKSHQDLLFETGGFGSLPDAVIFEGGVEADSIPDIQLVNPNQRSSFGLFNRTKPAVGDLNGDGFYDIALVNQASNEDAFVSSRAYIFSPNSGIEPVSNKEEPINPFEYRLSQNYPNPFNPATNIEFRLGNSSLVTLRVYDLLGREVATLIDGELYNKGSHQAKFDASALASGIYLYRLEAGGFIQTRKMTLIK